MDEHYGRGLVKNVTRLRFELEGIEALRIGCLDPPPGREFAEAMGVHFENIMSSQTRAHAAMHEYAVNGIRNHL
jgi:hypothetical protein